VRVVQVGLGDRNEALLAKAKELPSMEECSVFTDLKDAMKVLEADFVINITPPAIHKEINFIVNEST
jgi:predicted dehydrogenase